MRSNVGCVMLYVVVVGCWAVSWVWALLAALSLSIDVGGRPFT